MNLYDLLVDEDEERAKTRRINGVVTAIVTNNKDPDGLGRVKVKFPWLIEESESHWAKVASFMAGAERGGVFLPEVEDEVLVAFEHGDINYPYVIGALWNNKDMPPETNADGRNNIRKITSRSGHELIFNDDHAGGKEKITIQTNAGHQIVLDDSQGQENIEVKDKTGNNFVKIDSVRNDITVESAASIKIKSRMIEIEAGAMMTVKAGGALKIESGAILTIQGALVKIN